MADAHLSIGEVLSLLQDEFPDVTISKIRFLESQGLIDPERTPSGYRKFYESDIDRLRWILVQQRENFLPLKVIKDRLGSGDGVPADEPAAAAPVPPDAAPDEPGTAAAVADGEAAAPAAAPTVRASMPAGEAPGAPQPIWMADLAASRQAADTEAALATATAATLSATVAAPDGAAAGTVSDVSLSLQELAAATGLTLESLRELEQYGLLSGRSYGNDVYYDGDALLIATKAAAFLGHGIGARHLRMYKVAAEREAGFLEQVAMPLLKQRNPDARRQAVALVEELSDLGHDLRSALLRANLRQHLDRA
ncbi:MerR family DNA-binding transcriptional regulator [Aquihabitans sp. G128]|uniref:MerR family transcriptional regulator n=1 Tax=Aquihabitans sp. G128 TaxID=2849779 RepID=UPI001C24F795|nr:MerR family transcriptional regulator [Aquihabitans sp. G128]QXC61988.1 MerR family DNA-binding transcriptional regulator [Aquihabitans sp. G128]